MKIRIEFIMGAVIFAVLLVQAIIVFTYRPTAYKSYDIGGERIIACAKVRRDHQFTDFTDCTDGMDRWNVEGEVIALK